MSHFEATGTPAYSSFIFTVKYAKWLEDQQRRESWPETVKRYVDFFTERYPDHQKTLEKCGRSIQAFDIMPSMRALHTAGKALDGNLLAGFNCSYIAVDHPRAFDEAAFILMSGCGLGFSVERQYTNKLPTVSEEMYPTDTVIKVRDSRIGWATAIKELVSLLYSGQVPTWDVSLVRPKGARLKTFGGRASGPDPLVSLFKFMVGTFKGAKGRKLNSMECHDLMCKIGEIIISGGVRRSALISLSNPSDDRLRTAKSGQWWSTEPQRALANNSACYTEKPDLSTFLREWNALYESKSGERGIFNREGAIKHMAANGRREADPDVGINPCCVSFDTLVLTSEGPRRIDSLEGKPFTAIIAGESYKSETGSWISGEKDLFELCLESGHSVKLTEDHRVMTANRGWVEAGKLTVDDHISVLDPTPLTSRLVSFAFVERADVWDVEVSGVHSFSANGVHVHNSEILLRPMGLCNLTEVVVRPEDTLETLKEKLTTATILGTFQSTLTNYKYLRKKWQTNSEEERLLGVSLTGITDHKILGNPDHPDLPRIQAELKAHVVAVNKKWAKKLGISQSVATTTVKPSGSVSQLVNSASGIHPRFSAYYVRRVRVAKTDPVCQFLTLQGVTGEDDSYNNSSVVFSFPVKAPPNARLVADVSAIDQLRLWMSYSQNWAEHKVSCTVYYTDEEFLEVGAWVYKNFDDISGISFLPKTDHSYVQAPYEEITEDTYLKMVAEMPEIHWDQLPLYEKEDTTTSSHELACVGNACELVDIESQD
jgi:hypothetical protein